MGRDGSGIDLVFVSVVVVGLSSLTCVKDKHAAFTVDVQTQKPLAIDFSKVAVADALVDPMNGLVPSHLKTIEGTQLYPDPEGQVLSRP